MAARPRCSCGRGIPIRRRSLPPRRDGTSFSPPRKLAAMEVLDAAAIDVPGMRVRVLGRCTSTNELLLAEGCADVLLAAEEQTAGRGRRGRRWRSAPGKGVTFSMAKLVQRPLRELGGLSLAAGVGVARALRALGAAEVGLKWPNDLVVGDAKLGGILVQTRSLAPGVL